ncbi:hypothetical protein [Microbispora sp. KK1-11]|uniref:hypothetical protein n=1 Tax=Microbispora sp. KK1-11 TaxID=2053005 RepID=UPI00115B8563|nr:hypothetical protein [Microbispora sp. KK1-11]TQS30078.1 hypothetical protein FLW16_06870 [Microbispora sp. KK1-11]
MSYLIPVTLLLLIVCSLHEVEDDARTPGEVLAAARQMGIARSTGKVALAVIIVILLIATAFPLSLATLLTSLGGMR